MEFGLTDQQQATQALARGFSAHDIEPRAEALDRAMRLPDDLLPKLAKAGLLGLTVPKEFGGAAKGHVACILALEQLAYSGTAVWWIAGFNNSIPTCIGDHASQRIATRFVPPACQGNAYASIQFTEADTGSDPEALTTWTVPIGQEYVLNGQKHFSTFGARRGPAMVFAKDEGGMCTAFVIKKYCPGYTAGKVWETVGAGGAEPADVAYAAMRVPSENMLGAKGKGFDVPLDWICVEKVQQCASNVGLAQAALDEAVKYANGRMSRGRPSRLCRAFAGCSRR